MTDLPIASGARAQVQFQALTQIEHLSIDSAVACAAAVAVAAAVVCVIRRSRLAPSLASLWLLPALVVWLVSLGLDWRLMFGYWAFAVAVNVGAWQRHRRDLDAGSDLADRARDRRGFRYAARLIRRWRAVTAGDLTDNSGSRIGATRRGVLMRIGLGGLRPSHTVVFGETGSGKSWTLILLARLAIIGRGFGAVVIDPKCDPFMAASLANAATEAGKPFVVWTPSAQSIYNPLSRGSVTEVVDKLLAGERFTEPHYMRLAQRFLQQEVRALKAAGEVVSLAAVVANFDPGRLELIARRLPEGVRDEFRDYLDSMTAREWSDLAGTRNRLAVLAESDFGPSLDPRTPGTQLDLLSAIKAGAVVLFQVEADRFQLVSEMITAAVTTDLVGISALGQDGSLPSTLVMIDEASAVSPHMVARLYQRARGAGMSTVIATQNLADFDAADAKVGNPAGVLLKQIEGNADTTIAHRQGEPEAAEYLAGVAGTAGAWETTYQADTTFGARHTGQGSRRRVRQYTVHPDVIKTLAVGEAVVMPKGRRAQIVRMLDPTRTRIEGSRDAHR